MFLYIKYFIYTCRCTEWFPEKEQTWNGMVFGGIYISLKCLNMENCNLGNFEKKVLFLIEEQHKFLVVDICSEMPSNRK